MMEKLKMSKTPWRYVDDEDMAGCMDLVDADGNEVKYNVLIANDLDNYDWRERNANGEGIKKAVNNTYGAGIDPEAAEDMKEALEEIVAMQNLDKGNAKAIANNLAGLIETDVMPALKKAEINV